MSGNFELLGGRTKAGEYARNNHTHPTKRILPTVQPEAVQLAFIRPSLGMYGGQREISVHPLFIRFRIRRSGR